MDTLPDVLRYEIMSYIPFADATPKMLHCQYIRHKIMNFIIDHLVISPEEIIRIRHDLSSFELNSGDELNVTYTYEGYTLYLSVLYSVFQCEYISIFY